MTTPHTNGATLASKIEQEFAQLRTEAENCASLDRKYMDEHESFWDQVGDAIKNFFTEKSFMIPVVGVGGAIAMVGFSANDARQAADDYYEDTKRLMWQAYDDMCLYWSDELKDAAVGTDRLAQKADAWQAERKNSIEQLLTDLKKIEDQDHWKGEGSEAYHKAIPSQRGALHELGRLVDHSATVYKQGSRGLELVYQALKDSTKLARDELRNVAPVTELDQWGMRMRQATELFKSIHEQMVTINNEWMVDFGKQLNEIQDALVVTTEGSVPFAHGKGKWPEARGDLSHMSPKEPQNA